ncbi:MAG: cupin domain-containing protein [Chitinophagaceae bacterium]|nr:cupin domain-containing protein [Chitinophagaceae bacterium]MCW5906001.1 cupin domain-containing protein [Chitinophagaceae bacterium]
MEYKSNDATPLRPQGDRVLNAPLVEMDLNKFIEQIKTEATWQESSHNSITIFKSDSLRIVLIGMHKNAVLKKHTTNAIISVQVLKGTIQFITDKETVSLTKGQMIALQPKISHSVQATTESFFLLSVAALDK